MSSVTLAVRGQGSEGALGHAHGVPLDIVKRRIARRRLMLIVQAVNLSLITSVLLLYGYAGLVPTTIPAAYFLSSIGLIGVFAVLSETNVSERFNDHHLTVYQVGGHLALQLIFLLLAPAIGYVFLSVVFLIFTFGALRMTPRQAAIAWSLTTLGLASIFLLTTAPIGMPAATEVDRLTATLSYALVIGQCAFVGLYGSSMRKLLYDRGFELKEANRRIEQLAELDELTGALNRRYIMRTLNDEISRARRGGSPCSIALMDLDWFKRINDTYGHPAGDEVLSTFAITVFANIRNIDRFGRFGGEEFLLVLPDTHHESAIQVVERLRSIVAELDWSAFSPGMRVTVSAGIATLNPNETSDAILARADRALYAAKAQGRNSIVASCSTDTYSANEETAGQRVTPG